MSASAPDFLTVTYRPDLQVLLVRWMRVVTLAEMQQGYQYLLDVAVTHQCRQWLLDARRRFNTDREGARWMIDSFLPSLHARLGGRTYLAYLLVPAIMRDAAADGAFPPPEFFVGKPFIGQRFEEENTAIAWLQEGRRHNQPLAGQ